MRQRRRRRFQVDRHQNIPIHRYAVRVKDHLAQGDIVFLKMTAHLASVMAVRLHAMDDEVVKLISERSGPDRDAGTVPLYDIAEARDRVMMQWKVN